MARSGQVSAVREIRTLRSTRRKLETGSRPPRQLSTLPGEGLFDDMLASASHRALKQDMTVFSLVIRTIRYFSWELLCLTPLSLIIPARTMARRPVVVKTRWRQCPATGCRRILCSAAQAVLYALPEKRGITRVSVWRSQERGSGEKTLGRLCWGLIVLPSIHT